MNISAITGRLTQNPVSYSTKTGTTYCKFTVAVDRPFTTNGEKKTDFINCTCFSKQASAILKYLSKGSLVAVVGRLQTSKYYDERSQKNVYTTDLMTDNVQFLDNKRKEVSGLTGEIPNPTVNPSVTSIRSNEIDLNNEVDDLFSSIDEDQLPF